jgi:hypothetical protein
MQNVSAITLQETLDDYVAGLNATCRSSADALDFVRQEVDAAGLSGWTVQGDEGADGTTTCADTTIVNAKAHTVLLRAMGAPQDPSASYEKLAAKLRQLSGCRSAHALTRQVRAAAEDLGLSEAAHEFILTEVAADGPCAVVHETVGGTIFLTVRGPLS